MKTFFQVLLYTSFLLSFYTNFTSAEVESPLLLTRDLPAVYQGRFRSLDATSRLWLHDLYHRQKIKNTDLEVFKTKEQSALELLWKIHFFGHTLLDEAPLFWIQYAIVKKLLELDLSKNWFSYNEISRAAFKEKKSNLQLISYLINYEFAKSYYASNQRQSQKIELSTLTPNLWISLKDNYLNVLTVPNFPPWNFLEVGFSVPFVGEEILRHGKLASNEILQLFHKLHEYMNYSGANLADEDMVKELLGQLEKQELFSKEIAHQIEKRLPLTNRLQSIDSTLKMLPLRSNPGEWVSLKALKLKVYDPKEKRLILINNFTTFPDQLFYKLRSSYLALELAIKQFYSFDPVNKIGINEFEYVITNFTNIMLEAYKTLAERPYKKATNKQLFYPSIARIKAETLYYQLPFIEITIGVYIISLFLFLLAYSFNRNLNFLHPFGGIKTSRARSEAGKKSKVQLSRNFNYFALIVLALGFCIHTIILALRCYILQRPPVSNMFETVIYVPWVALLFGFIFYFLFANQITLIAACLASLSLLTLLKLTKADSNMENVQAVLDSQYWLIIHVLMVVGSYGAFILSGILGHFFLISISFKRKLSDHLDIIAQGILHTMYAGVALLIPGTILGGVWAAESWGRFWDWDPKESWAFISACIYLLIIHAYTFHRIRNFGLAIGSILGIMAISFTWYGVNYILGTGLHSYGFGNGGEKSYFIFLLFEVAFIGIVFLRQIMMHPGEKTP